MSVQPPAPHAATPWKWLLRVILGAAIVALLLSRRDAAAQVAATLRAVPLWVIIGAVAFYWAGQFLSALKWQLLLRARGTRVSLARCCRIYAAGMFGNLWLPTNVGGDALRATLLAKRAPELGRADALASIAVERLTGFAALLIIAASALLLRGASAQGWQTLAIAGAIFVGLGVLWGIISRIKHPVIARLQNALSFYARPQHRAVLARAMLLSLAFQASQVLLNIGLACAVELDLPARVFWWLGPLLSLSGLIPAGIGGLGVREAAAVALLRDWPVCRRTNRRLVAVVASDSLAGELAGRSIYPRRLIAKNYLDILNQCCFGSTFSFNPSARTGAAIGT